MVLYELGRDFRVSTERSTSQQMIMGVLKKMLKRISKNKVQNELKKDYRGHELHKKYFSLVSRQV